MQYKIPQNVGIEDRIVGPLTLRQLIILAGGFGISYILFAILSKIYELNIFEYIVIALPMLLAAAFALIKINDIRLIKFILLFLEFSIKPKKRIWDHRGISSLVAPDLIEEKKEGLTPFEQSELDRKAKRAANLRELTKMLDSGEFQHVKEVEHKDIDVTRDDDLVTQAYFGHKRKESPTENMYWRTKDSQLKRLEILASLPVTKLKKGTKETEIAKQQILDAKKEAEESRKKSPQPSAYQPKTAIAKTADTKTGTSDISQHAKPIAPIQAKSETLNPPLAKSSAQAPVAKKDEVNKPRKRNRQIPQPVRKNNTINTLNKNAPAKYIPKNPQMKDNSAQSKKTATSGKSGEFDFRELQKGEIEINLD